MTNLNTVTVMLYAAVSITVRFGLSEGSLNRAVLIALLVMCTESDLKKMIIPDRIIAAGIELKLVMTLLMYVVRGTEIAVGIGDIVIIPAGLLLSGLTFEALWKKRVIGGGDIKLFMLIGAFLGTWMTMVALFIACAAGILLAMLLRSREFPWAPAVTVAVYIAAVSSEIA